MFLLVSHLCGLLLYSETAYDISIIYPAQS